MAEQRVRPSQIAGDLTRVGIEQELMGIEAQATLRFVWAVRAIAVKKAGARPRQIAVPNLVRPLGKRHDRDLSPARRIEQTQIDALGAAGKYGEIYAESVRGRSQRIWTARAKPRRK